ncbi:hypothetical protein PENNAL_c0121G00646 [Penicillium nalgiovense]|uniref:Uncharacterized protein n=1 Tax=Penicillium nalgiovense TaxID=60175 RepID=A0A1V6X4X9_PENNA|nr:hypothetical protein PENNAL_c0121G00646 [Penicillium nalgiovense]
MSASPRFVRHAQPGWDCCPGEGRDAHAEKEGAAIGGAEDGHRNAERTLSQYIRVVLARIKDSLKKLNASIFASQKHVSQGARILQGPMRMITDADS